jgi:hypothetical protein
MVMKQKDKNVPRNSYRDFPVLKFIDYRLQFLLFSLSSVYEMPVKPEIRFPRR